MMLSVIAIFWTQVRVSSYLWLKWMFRCYLSVWDKRSSNMTHHNDFNLDMDCSYSCLNLLASKLRIIFSHPFHTSNITVDMTWSTVVTSIVTSLSLDGSAGAWTDRTTVSFKPQTHSSLNIVSSSNWIHLHQLLFDPEVTKTSHHSSSGSWGINLHNYFIIGINNGNLDYILFVHFGSILRLVYLSTNHLSPGIVCLDTSEVLFKYSSRKLDMLGMIIDDCWSSHQRFFDGFELMCWYRCFDVRCSWRICDSMASIWHLAV